MRKILMSLMCVYILTINVSADAMRIEAGVGAWIQTPSGELSYSDNSGNSGLDKSQETQEVEAYVWALIKHPVPILPNFRLEYVNVENIGLATGTFKNFTVPMASKTIITMTQFDIIPYYNILDNTGWITLDIGLDIKVVDASYEAVNVNVLGVAVPTNYSESALVAFPLLYARGRVEIPSTNLAIESDIKYVRYSGATVYDFRAKVDYILDIDSPVKPGIEIGYRLQKMQYDDSLEDAKVDLDFSGVYAGIVFCY